MKVRIVRRNQILAIAVCAFACLLYSNKSTTAGWFGPSNYDECVLDEIKGQPAYMYFQAHLACQAKFPQQVSLDQRLIQAGWCEDTDTEKQLCITDKPDSYQIKSIELDLFPCNLQTTNVIHTDIWGNELPPTPDPCLSEAVKIMGEKSYFSQTYTFKIPPGNYLEQHLYYSGFTN
jgi:hypothetical protein